MIIIVWCSEAVLYWRWGCRLFIVLFGVYILVWNIKSILCLSLNEEKCFYYYVYQNFFG